MPAARPRTKFHVTGTAGKSHQRYLLSMLGRLMPRELGRLREVSVALVGDAKMADLHQRFMGIPGPTDVLSFELDHDTQGNCTSGEIVICVPYARRSAKALGLPERHEVALYAVHGILHLTGHDDHDDHDHALMHKREDNILTRLGVGPVFYLEHRTRKPKPRGPNR